MRSFRPRLFLAASSILLLGCSSADGDFEGEGSGGGSWTANTGGSTGEASGGASAVGGTGGNLVATGGNAGEPATGGNSDSGGGTPATGGTSGSTGGGESGGADGSGGAGGMEVFKPCPSDGSPCTILPLGDSITHGAKSSDLGGYRSRLYKLILAADQKVTFTGKRSNGPAQVSGQPFPSKHEGHPGWTIEPGYNTTPGFDGGMTQLIPSPALDENPHIILLHIGTNDLWARDTANMANRLDALLDMLIASAPNSLIVLAQITPRSEPNAALSAYNAKIPEIVERRSAAGEHIIGVDMSALPLSGLSDGTHPNDSGYSYMADVWYAAIKDLLPQ